MWCINPRLAECQCPPSELTVDLAYDPVTAPADITRPVLGRGVGAGRAPWRRAAWLRVHGARDAGEARDALLLLLLLLRLRPRAPLDGGLPVVGACRSWACVQVVGTGRLHRHSFAMLGGADAGGQEAPSTAATAWLPQGRRPAKSLHALTTH
jgi:hypothetical protein